MKNQMKQTPADEAKDLPYLSVKQEKQVAIEVLEDRAMEIECELENLNPNGGDYRHIENKLEDLETVIKLLKSEV